MRVGHQLAILCPDSHIVRLADDLPVVFRRDFYNTLFFYQHGMPKEDPADVIRRSVTGNASDSVEHQGNNICVVPGVVPDGVKRCAH